MFRSTTSVLALLAAMSVPAFAADYGQDFGGLGGDSGFRNGYPTEPGEWAGLGDKDDPVKFEFGARYWYSMGSQTFSDAAGGFTSDDTSHILEGHLRIEDHSTNTFAKAIGGYAVKMSGTYADPYALGSVVDGRIGYAGADIGWNPWGDNSGSGFGGLLGYMYWNNSPNTDRFSYTSAESATDIGYDPNTGHTSIPMTSSDNNVDIHMLRLGVQGKYDAGMFDITGEVAAVPFAKVNGIIGSDQTATILDHSVYLPGNVASVKASPTALDGWGYGAMTEAFVGFHPTDNLVIRLGGRAWYVQGTADVTYSQAHIGNPSDSDAVNPPNFDTGPSFSKQAFIEKSNPFKMLRYGLLAELTYAF